MEGLRNLPLSPTAMAALIDYSPASVVSMALSQQADVSMTLFAFDEGDGISTEYYLGDTLYLVIEGQMPLQQDGRSSLLAAGDCVCVPAKTKHAIGGAGRFKLLQITLHAQS
ncbi:MAG: cupin domain-containing protein [Eubacteriales bacterium]|nr:cupin domain-containing protein [Eubacteriales bacterium]